VCPGTARRTFSYTMNPEVQYVPGRSPQRVKRKLRAHPPGVSRDPPRAVRLGPEAEILLDGDQVGFVPQIPGSENFDEAQIVDAIARADYDQPEGWERAEAPPDGPPLAHEGGVFRRFRDGFRYDSE
jgi:hypothetical protein